MINGHSIDDTLTATWKNKFENFAYNTIMNKDNEMITDFEKDKKKFNIKEFYRERKLPEIGYTAVKNRSNRLSISNGVGSGLNRKLRSRSVQQKALSNTEPEQKAETKVAKLKTSSTPRSRTRRPGLRHLNKEKYNRNDKDKRMIKRMRNKSEKKTFAITEDTITSSRKEKEGKGHSKLRLLTGKIIIAGRRKASFIKSYLKGRRREFLSTTTTIPTTTTTTSTTSATTTPTILATTEKITIRPNAHRIRYTLDDSLFVDITSENPIVVPEDISGISKSIDQPITIVPVPDTIHKLKKSKKTSSEQFLPTLVPLVRKTPSKNLPDEIPIFVAGTKQSEERLEDLREPIFLPPVKSGRYVLAASINR